MLYTVNPLSYCFPLLQLWPWEAAFLPKTMCRSAKLFGLVAKVVWMVWFHAG